MNFDINILKRMEEQFILEDFKGSSFIIKDGIVPIMVSAPHSVPQVRNGNIKKGEYLTGVLATLLHEETNCYCAYKTKNVNDDANFDEVHPYKSAIVETALANNIIYLIDLHIMSAKRSHMIDIGTAHGRNIKHQFKLIHDIQKIFQDFSIQEVEIDKIFTAGNPNTVSSTIARESHIISIQIEINWALLDLTNGIYGFSNVFQCLTKIIHYLYKKGIEHE